jgi:hypothetical protein
MTTYDKSLTQYHNCMRDKCASQKKVHFERVKNIGIETNIMHLTQKLREQFLKGQISLPTLEKRLEHIRRNTYINDKFPEYAECA